MKKGLIIFLAVFISIIPLSASSTPLIELQADNSNSFELYSPSAQKIDGASEIDSFGYLIKTKQNDVKLSTPLGEIYIDAGSDFLFVEDSPITLFLISGKASIVISEDLEEEIILYTPTTKTLLKSKGEYSFISTEDYEEFYNFSESSVESLDGITGKNFVAGPMEFIDYLNQGNPEEVTEEIYQKISAINNILFTVPVPKAPLITVNASLKRTIPEAPVLSVRNSTLKKIAPEIPALDIIKAEVIATTPEKPAFSITTASTLSSLVPESLKISSATELVALPVIIKGKFEKRIQVLDIQPQIKKKELTAEDSKSVPEIIDTADVAEIIENTTVSENIAPIVSSNQISGTATKKFNVDMLFSTRSFTDSETKEQKLAFSFQPLFRYGAFALTLNLDPVHILSYTDNETAIDWVRYSIAFLENLRYRSLDEHFAIVIDRSTYVKGDSVGLYSGVNHLSDGKNERLSLSFDVKYPLFGLRLYANDLLLNADRKLINGIDFDFRFSRDLPVGIILGLLSSSNINDYVNSTILYPEFAFYLPFYTKGSDYVGMKVGMSLSLQPSRINDYSISSDGYLISGVLPMKFGAFSAEPGIHYTNGPLHYNSVDSENYNPITREDSSTLSIASKLSYDGKYFGGKANVLFDVALSDMTPIKENSFLDASLYFRFSNLKLSGGLEVQNFTSGESFKNSNAQIFGAIDFTFPSVATYIKAGITDLKDKHFFLTYGASASFFSSDSSAREIKERDKHSPIHFDMITGYKYRFSSEKASYQIKPIIQFGRDSYYIALRAPIQLSFNDSKEFVLEGQNDNRWWDFGTSETDPNRKIYKAVTDSVSLIEGIRLSEEDNIAYLIAERGKRKNGTLFTAFGSEDMLSLQTGFNFVNLSLGIFVDNLESPHIEEFSIGILPLGRDSLSIGIKVPGEMLFQDLKNFDMNFYPEFRLDLPLFRNHFCLSAIAIGNIGVEYNDGIPTNTSVIYDFTNSRFSSAMIGGEIGLDFTNITFRLQGGYRIGNLTPEMYNRFTSFYNEIPTPTTRLSSAVVQSNDGYYGKISSEFKFSNFGFELAYSVANIENLYKDITTANDIFSAKMSMNFNEALSFYASFDRRGFARLFTSKESFFDVMKDKNTLFAIGLDFNYGILNMNAEYATALNSTGFSSVNPYINTNPVYTGTTTTSLSVTTRIHF